MDGLEEYLSGGLKPVDLREFEAHLSACDTCREEVAAFRDLAGLFAPLRTQETPDLAPGFYARVMQRVEAQKPAPSFFSLFALDVVFGRRLAFASLVLMALLGSVLVTRETYYPAGPTPESVMAQQASPAFDSESGENNMLVTLTAYEY